jgi:hypothetical protein
MPGIGVTDGDTVSDGDSQAGPVGAEVTGELAIGTSEGFVHVWDIIERRPVQEIFVAPTQMQGVAFLTNTHLAVAPQPGGVQVLTIDPVELADVVSGSLTRGFTKAECERYGFGTNCPTLEELAGA